MLERLDGSGYPNSLRGEQIRPLARVLGVVDVFCALTEPRGHRRQMSAGKALLHLAEQLQVIGDVRRASAELAP
jgi:HD-GYP domain-containing protein (c-di-GMP phosphodiesterase class II)